MKALYLSTLLALAVGCGKVGGDPPEPTTADAAPADAAQPTPIDAGTDAPAPTSRPGNAPVLLTGAGVSRSATFTLTVQIGEAIVPRPVAGPTTTLAPRGAIQP